MSHYLDAEVEAQRVRAMLDAHRAMEAAQDAYYAAQKYYIKAQGDLTGAFPSSARPGPYVCGNIFIEATAPNEEGVCFDYTQATRIHTSE